MEISDHSGQFKFRFAFFLLLVILSFLTILFSVSLGPVSIPFKQIVFDLIHPHNAKGVFGEILLKIRLPRVLLGFLVGGTLAVAGAGLQGSLRNPLADPYIIGTSSGAALGAAVCFLLGFESFHLVPVFAFVGAGLSIFAVLALSRRKGELPVTRVLLAGVVVGSLVWALVTFLLTMSGKNIAKLVFWLMGSLNGRTWSDFFVLLPYAVGGTIFMMLLAYPLNLLTLGEERAESLGIHPEKIKLLILLISSLLTAAAVAVSGLIGFIGLIVPHAVRILSGPDHRTLIPFSFLTGGIILVWSDTFARLVFQPAELPVGVVTALLGSPFFLYLLKRSQFA